MDKKQKYKLMRKDFNPVGWSMLVYYLLLQVCVTMVIVVAGVYYSFMAGINGMTEEQVNEALMGNAWGYLLTIALGFFIMWLWKGKRFCFKELWTGDRAMKVGDFFCLLSVFMCAQFLFSMISLVMEAILNVFGFSAMKAVESATSDANTLSMFLYMAFGAPIAEEILCRGLVLRPMAKYGKRFAIFMSAFFFGLLHGNIVQTPFAFVVGLVLGYVSLEYNLLWAIVLHMINNLVLGDMINRIFGAELGNTITGLLIIGFMVAGIIILIVRRDETKAYIKANKVDNEAVRCFFTSPGVLVASIVLYLFMMLSFFMMQ
jgi:membrane protease YdiL (CAAX protease family)